MINPFFIKIILVMVRTDWGGVGGRKAGEVFILQLCFKLKYDLVIVVGDPFTQWLLKKNNRMDKNYLAFIESPQSFCVAPSYAGNH